MVSIAFLLLIIKCVPDCRSPPVRVRGNPCRKQSWPLFGRPPPSRASNPERQTLEQQGQHHCPRLVDASGALIAAWAPFSSRHACPSESACRGGCRRGPRLLSSGTTRRSGRLHVQQEQHSSRKLVTRGGPTKGEGRHEPLRIKSAATRHVYLHQVSHLQPCQAALCSLQCHAPSCS